MGGLRWPSVMGVIARYSSITLEELVFWLSIPSQGMYSTCPVYMYICIFRMTDIFLSFCICAFMQYFVWLLWECSPFPYFTCVVELVDSLSRDGLDTQVLYMYM